MKKDNIDNLFDKEFEEFIKGEIMENYSPDEEAKKRIKERVLRNIENNKSKEGKDNITSISDVKEKNMKVNNKKKIGKLAVVAASFAIVIGIGTGITIGKGFMTTTKVVKSGRITVEEEKLDVDPSEIIVRLPKELKGKVFDKNKKEVEVLNGSMKELYDENGNKIERLPIDENGNYKPENQEDFIEYSVFKDVKEAQKHSNFTLRILPGMKVDKVEFMKENGKIDGNYATIYQSKDGQNIVLSERKGENELSYETGGSKVDQVKVLGKDAILYNTNIIELDNGDSYIGINAKLSDYKNEKLVKLANTLVEVK